MHFNFDDTVTFTGFTTPALYIKGKSVRLISTHFCILCLCKQITDIAKYTCVCCRVGTRCAADCRLVNTNNLVHIFKAYNIFVCTWFYF